MKLSSATIVLGFLLALVVYSLLLLYERKETTIDLGPGKEARQNPFLAAERYLETLGVDARAGTEYSWIDMVDVGDTLLITSTDLIVSDKRTQKLLQWLRDGGHLILAPGDSEQGRQWIAENLGVGVLEEDHGNVDHGECFGWLLRKQSAVNMELERDLTEGSQIPTPADGDYIPPFCRESGYLTKVTFRGLSNGLLVNLHDESEFEANANEWASVSDSGVSGPDGRLDEIYTARDAWGERFIQVRQGMGLVSLVANTEIWTNGQIGNFDNALFLAMLTESERELFIFHGSGMPPLTTLVWRNGGEFILVATILLILWLWYAGVRPEPVYEPSITIRREILEHLNAKADFHWRSRNFDALLRPLRDDIDYQFSILMVDYVKAARVERNRLIAEYCDVSLAQVDSLFSDSMPHDQTTCEQAIRFARNIRKAL